MGIMNKMKTVDLGTLNWIFEQAVSGDNFYSTETRADSKKLSKVYCSRFTSIIVDGTGGNYRNHAWISSSGSINITADGFNKDPNAFKSAMQGVLLTYETANSVEDEIVSYKAQNIFDQSKISDQTINGLTIRTENGRLIIDGTATQNTNLITSYPYNVVVAGHKYFRRNIKSNGLSLYGYYPLDNESIVTATGNNSYFTVTIPAGTHIDNYKTRFAVVDLTALYGAGNEPTSVATFLSQHPEYNSYVPFYDGEINITEEIM